VECQFSVEKVKGHGHRTSKTSRNCRIYGVYIYLRATDQAPAAQAPTANYGLTTARPNLLSTETLGNWTDGRISCRHIRNLVSVLVHGALKHKVTRRRMANSDKVERLCRTSARCKKSQRQYSTVGSIFSDEVRQTARESPRSRKTESRQEAQDRSRRLACRDGRWSNWRRGDAEANYGLGAAMWPRDATRPKLSRDKSNFCFR